MPAPVVPFWMAQRQIKLEVVNDGTPMAKLNGPNMQTHQITLTPVTTGPGWRIALDRVSADGVVTPVAQTECPFDKIDAAWQVAFELFRGRAVT
jgi:hypothetical protein